MAQLNRQVTTRDVKRPTLADYRDSGEIEEAADIALLLYRPGYYDKHANQQDLHIIVAKNRQGAPDEAIVDFDAPTGRLKDPGERPSPPPALPFHDGDT